MTEPEAVSGAAATSAAAPAPARVLIAEDERHLGVLLEHFLAARGHQVTVVHDGREALARVRATAFDVALLDVQMPGLDGLSVLRGIRELPLPPEVIIMTGNGTVDTALTVLQGGAYDYIAKPYRMAEVDLLVRRAAERRGLAAVAAASMTAVDDGEFVTRFAPLRAVLDLVDRSAPTLIGMVVSGEPGVGRCTIARRVHRQSAGGTLVTLDGAALARGAMNEPALARGLAAAGGGTLLVRDIDRAPMAAQRALARALDGSGNDGTRPPARLVATAARPLDGVAIEPALRERVAALTVELPPLRERPGDVAALVEHFVRQLGGVTPPVVTTDALALLETPRWPGNVAELRLIVDGAVSRAVDGVIGIEQLGLA